MKSKTKTPKGKTPVEIFTAEEKWHKEFAGKCVSCAHSRVYDHARKHAILCQHQRAANHGFPKGAGAPEPSVLVVHKLFGCVFWRDMREPF